MNVHFGLGDRGRIACIHGWLGLAVELLIHLLGLDCRALGSGSGGVVFLWACRMVSGFMGPPRGLGVKRPICAPGVRADTGLRLIKA